jgi:hypothetical protein
MVMDVIPPCKEILSFGVGSGSSTLSTWFSLLEGSRDCFDYETFSRKSWLIIQSKKEQNGWQNGNPQLFLLSKLDTHWFCDCNLGEFELLRANVTCITSTSLHGDHFHNSPREYLPSGGPACKGGIDSLSNYLPPSAKPALPRIPRDRLNNPWLCLWLFGNPSGLPTP